MNFIFHILFLYFSLIKFSSSLVVLPFELNQITFKNERYSATELAYILTNEVIFIAISYNQIILNNMN